MMDGNEALRILAEAPTSDFFSRNVADFRPDLPDTDRISISVSLGAIRAARKALGMEPRRRDSERDFGLPSAEDVRGIMKPNP
jgi:hypothetical protein